MTYNSLYSPVNVNDYLKFGTVVVVMIDSEYNNKHRQQGDNAQEKIVVRYRSRILEMTTMG